MTHLQKDLKNVTYWHSSTLATMPPKNLFILLRDSFFNLIFPFIFTKITGSFNLMRQMVNQISVP